VGVQELGQGRGRHREPLPELPPEHLPELFKRFWRGAARRDTGAGLGLAICHEIALAHGWSLVARNGTVGAEFLVSFEA